MSAAAIIPKRVPLLSLRIQGLPSFVDDLVIEVTPGGVASTPTAAAATMPPTARPLPRTTEHRGEPWMRFQKIRWYLAAGVSDAVGAGPKRDTTAPMQTKGLTYGNGLR